jgi:hypothetical protein
MAKIVDDIASLQTKIDKAKSSKIAMYERYKKGKLTRDMYIEEKNRSEDNITSMQGRLDNMVSEALRSEPHVHQFVDSFNEFHHLAEPQLVSELVAEIKIHTVDDIAVTWNFEDEFKLGNCSTHRR